MIVTRILAWPSRSFRPKYIWLADITYFTSLTPVRTFVEKRISLEENYVHMFTFDATTATMFTYADHSVFGGRVFRIRRLETKSSANVCCLGK